MKKTITESQLKKMINNAIVRILSESTDDEIHTWQDDVETTEAEPYIKVNLATIADSIFDAESENFLIDLYAVTEDDIFDCEYIVISKWCTYYGENYLEDYDNRIEVIENLKDGLNRLQDKYSPQNITKFYNAVIHEIEKKTKF